MNRLRRALEDLDDLISGLEDRLYAQKTRAARAAAEMAEAQKKQNEQIKMARAREASAIAASQKVAKRLDDTIEHVSRILQ